MGMRGGFSGGSVWVGSFLRSSQERSRQAFRAKDLGLLIEGQVEGDQDRASLVALAEGFYKVPKIRAKETSAVQLWLFSRLPKLARQSTTLDNGSEHYLHLHTRLQEELGMRTYFADPYCSPGSGVPMSPLMH
jgi:hypothetical protein